MGSDVTDISSIDNPRSTSQLAPIQLQRATDYSHDPLPDDTDGGIDTDDSQYHGIVWTRLPGYIRPPKNDKLRAWFWRYGYCIQKAGTSDRLWLCRECHTRKPCRTTKYAGAGVDNIKKHLFDVHRISKDGPMTLKRSRSVFEQLQLNAVDPRDQQVMNWMNGRFDPEHFKKLLINWVVCDTIPFCKLESQPFRDMCGYLHPEARRCIPHHTTMRKMVIDEYERYLPVVGELLQAATTRIHLSFDIWTSRQKLCLAGNCSLLLSCSRANGLVGIVAHFLDQDFGCRTLLLSLPEQVGQAGVRISTTIQLILDQFKLAPSRLGYFVADNASENDTCVRDLEEALGYHPSWRRVRCMGHIINLVARALLFGESPDSFEEEENGEPLDDIIKQQKRWRKLGPIGKLHNVVIWIRASTERQKEFQHRQRASFVTAGDPDAATKPVYSLIPANGTRWNSNQAEMQRAIELRNAIDELIAPEVMKWNSHVNRVTAAGIRSPTDRLTKPSIVDDYLTAEDWNVIAIYLDILKPLEKATLLLQGRPSRNARTGIWHVLPTMEWLLHQFESFKVEYQLHPDLHFRRSIDQAWAKLDKYYQLTEASPIYVAAVVLNPRWKWAYFEKQWTDRQDWISDARRAIKDLWAAEYKDQPLLDEAPEPQQREILLRSDLDDFINNVLGPPPTRDVPDEYECYISRGIAPEDQACETPIAYWVEKRRIWPRLSKMALDILSIPPMSDEPERIFSLSGLMTVANRGRLQTDIIGASICLANWQRMGVAA